MRRLMLAAGVAAFALGSFAIGSVAAPSVAMADYAAIAAGYGGWGSAESGYRSMEGARQAAIRQCRQNGGSCSASTAEHADWYFAAGYCDGVPYTAASPQGAGRASAILRAKGAADGNYNCDIAYTF